METQLGALSKLLYAVCEPPKVYQTTMCYSVSTVIITLREARLLQIL